MPGPVPCSRQHNGPPQPEGDEATAFWPQPTYRRRLWAQLTQWSPGAWSYGLWAEAVRSLGNDNLIPAVDRVYRRQSLQPLVEAARKITETPSVQPGHFPWRRPDGCVVSQYDDGDTYTEHIGPSITMPIPKGMDVRDDELLHAVLVANEGYLSGPEVSFNSGGNGVPLAADELDAVIDDLADFLDGLRSLRGQMTLGASIRSAAQPAPAAPSAHASLTQAPENKAAPKSTNADPDAA